MSKSMLTWLLPTTAGEALLKNPPPRNARLYDAWSTVHILTGILFGLIFPILPAFVVMVLWEPLEVLLLSPFLMRRGIIFGYEALPNSLTDILFDAVGIALSYAVVTHIGQLPNAILMLVR